MKYTKKKNIEINVIIQYGTIMYGLKIGQLSNRNRLVKT